MFANSGRLFRSAVELQKGVSSLNAAGEQAQRESLASIVFAAISAEAFINELPELAADAAGTPTEPAWVRALGEIVGAAEESHASIESKYHLASLVLTGHVFDKGAQPFQDFKFLVDLRNLVVHTKPGEAIRQKEADGEWTWSAEMTREIKRVMSRLEQHRSTTAGGHVATQFIPREDAATISSNWLAEISTEAVAGLACRAAAEIVKAVLDAIPDSPRFKGLVETIYRKDFQFS